MGKIFCIMGKSSCGKDTIYKLLLQNEALQLKKIVPYTTRPIRVGEKDGVEYNFSDQEQLKKFQEEGKVIECRSYNTFYGIWNYFTVKDNQIDLEHHNYLIIGTVESFIATRDYFGKDVVIPIYIAVDDGERLQRALNRERKQTEPKYEEMCRRFLADQADFSKEKLEEAGIEKTYFNGTLSFCISEIMQDLMPYIE